MNRRDSAFKRCARWRIGLEAAVSDSNRSISVVWETLLAEQRQSLVRTLGEMALRQVRQAPVIKEAPDDDREARIGAPRHAA